MGYPPVIVVDEKDQEVGLEMLSGVWDRGLYHRMVRVMVEDPEGYVLLQRRHAGMRIFPGYWDNSAAGHVDGGMSYLTAARQEVAEEIGITNPDLIPVERFFMKHDYTSGHKMYNFNMLYKLKVASRDSIVVGPDEVSEVKWVSKAELAAMAADGTEITPGLAYVILHYY